MNAEPKCRRLLLASGAAIALALTSATLTAAQEFKLTPAKELAANPHRFWARGVVFRDTLISTPSLTRIKIADRVTFPFATKTVGACLAADEIAPVLRNLQTDREYIFTATVYSENRGLIRRRPIYRILVEGVIAPAADVGELTKQAAARAIAERAENDAYATRLRTLGMLVTRVQEYLTVTAAGEAVERKKLFDPESEHFEKLILAARRAVNDLEVESGVPSREHFAQTLVALVALAENRLETPAEDKRLMETPLSPADLPSFPPVPDEVPAEPVKPTPQIEEKSSAGAQETQASSIVPTSPPSAPLQAEEPTRRRRERSRSMKDAKPLPVPSLQLSTPLAAPVIESEPKESEPASPVETPAAQLDRDAALADEVQMPDSSPPRKDQELDTSTTDGSP